MSPEPSPEVEQSGRASRSPRARRAGWVDATRGVAIALVVVGHVVQFSDQGRFDVFRNPLFVVIYAFHMPLFIFISGYLAYGSFQRKSGATVVTSRVRNLLLPFAAWTLIGNGLMELGLALAKGAFTPASWGRQIGMEFAEPEKSLWFLWVLFVCYAVFAATRWAARHIRFAAVPLSVIIVFAVPLDLTLAWTQVKWLYPFFLAGYFLSPFASRLRRYERYATPAAVVGFAVLMLFWQRNDSVYVSRMGLVDGSVGATAESWAYQYAVAAVGIVAVIGLIRAVGRHVSTTWLQRLGMASLGIYCTEVYLLTPLAYGPDPATSPAIYMGLFVPLVSVIVLCLTYLITVKVLKRFRPFRMVLLGEAK